METLLRGLKRWVRPAEGWVAGLLLLVAVLSLPLAIGAAAWLPGADSLWPWSLLALVVGLKAANSAHAVRALIIVALVGVLLVTLSVAGAVPRPGVLTNALGATPGWLLGGRVGEWPGLAPLRASQTALTDFAAQVTAWGRTAGEGGGTTSTLPILWLTTLVLSLAALWAGWAFRHWRNAVIALAPTAVLMVSHTIFAPRVGPMFVFFLAASIGLLAHGRYLSLVHDWEAAGVDYSDEIHLDLNFAIALVILIIPLIAWAMPLPILYGPARAAWQAFETPRDAAGALAKRVLGPIQRPPVPGLFSPATPVDELPFSRVISGPPELSSQMVFQVRTNDPPPFPEGPAPVNRYWRLDTWDTYTGRGWNNTPWETRSVAASNVEDVAASLPVGTALVQRYTLSEGTGPIAVNAPLAVDQGYTRLERAVDDLVSIWLANHQYTVVSQPPRASPAQLRAAATIADDRYLALPRGVPDRVAALAAELTANKATAYDKAQAIETYLRGLPYDLTTLAAPPGRDVADYTLFDAQRGYCDPIATTMVVMLRSVGIPARLATGYINGNYDVRSGGYVVTGQEAHAWVEVPFAGIGWVEFEPTPGRPAITRPAADAPLATAAAAAVPASGLTGWLPFLVGLTALGLVVAGGVTLYRAVQRRRFLALPAATQVRVIWERVVARAERLGHGPQVGQTPLEYAADLGRDLAGREVEVGPWQLEGRDVEKPLAALGEAYTTTTYGDNDVDHATAERARNAWEWIQPRVWLLGWRGFADQRRRTKDQRG